MKTRLTDYDIKFWLENEWPLTVVKDRYNGCYSKGIYLAFPRDFNEIEEAVCGCDPECSQYWQDFDDFVGRGATIEEAVADLRRQFEEEREKGFPNCHDMNNIIGGIMGIFGKK